MRKTKKYNGLQMLVLEKGVRVFFDTMTRYDGTSCYTWLSIGDIDVMSVPVGMGEMKLVDAMIGIWRLAPNQVWEEK